MQSEANVARSRTMDPPPPAEKMDVISAEAQTEARGGNGGFRTENCDWGEPARQRTPKK